jgi:hypothetical protein
MPCITLSGKLTYINNGLEISDFEFVPLQVCGDVVLMSDMRLYIVAHKKICMFMISDGDDYSDNYQVTYFNENWATISGYHYRIWTGECKLIKFNEQHDIFFHDGINYIWCTEEDGIIDDFRNKISDSYGVSKILHYRSAVSVFYNNTKREDVNGSFIICKCANDLILFYRTNNGCWKKMVIDFDVDCINKFIGDIMIDNLGTAYIIRIKEADNNIFTKISHNNFFVDAIIMDDKYYLQDDQNNIHTLIANTLDTKLKKTEHTFKRIIASVKSANNVVK